MVALTTTRQALHPVNSPLQNPTPKTDARASTQVQITPQLIATRKTIQKIQQVAEYLGTTEYWFLEQIDGSEIAVVHAKVLEDSKPDVPLIERVPSGMRERCRRSKEFYVIETRQEMVFWLRERLKHRGIVGDPMPSFEELKKQRDALKDDPIHHKYDKTIYHTVLTGVALAFFPPNHPKVSEAAKKLSYLTPTLNQIVEVESIKRNINSLFTSRIVMKQVLDIVKDYSTNDSFKNIDPDKFWKLPSRFNTLANLPPIE
jgi:hypothetical protein